MRICSHCKKNEKETSFTVRDFYCKECRRKNYVKSRKRILNPDKCKICKINLKTISTTKKGFCSEKCEINGSVKINKNGCWEWQKHLSNTGYGYISRKTNKILAHRISYEMFNGPINENEVIRHKCNNRKCVNPEHLQIGNQWDNMQDAFKCGNIKRKLTWEQVCEMRERYIKGEKIKDIYKNFGIVYKTAQDIVTFKKWKKKPDEAIFR